MDPCNICGETEKNLVDGYYYCTECGTQDVNVRETVVEQTVLGDGTFAHTTSRKINLAVQNEVQMSSEWYKWHTFNFILVGLTDELIALGAKPSVKMKVLWIWSRYVKKFQIKDDLQLKNTLIFDDEDADTLKENNNENDRKESEGSSNNDSDHEPRRPKSKKLKTEKYLRDIKVITRGTLLAILYVALNLDRSDIQLSHLFRFIREGSLSLYDCMKHVPKDLKLNLVKNWKSFTLSVIEYNPITIRELSLTCFKALKLGVPLVPDLRKLVKNFIQELCLPSDVLDLVFALIHFMPIDFLDIDASIQKSLVRIPDYEGVCMAYILVALKMCFGLDDDYEERISNEIDIINEEKNYLKSFKLGLYPEHSNRLFSFKEWFQHLQFRKHILCKNYLPMARQFNRQTDDYVFMEHLEKRKKREKQLSDSVIVDILNKIELVQEFNVIPKTDFPATLTPMSTYLDVIAQHVKDPELRLLLCEDFTQYSLKYAIKDFKLPDQMPESDNPIIGVSESEKTFNKNVIGTLTGNEGDKTMVYVRNCENKNWLKTKPPKMQHVTRIGQNDNSSDKDSDNGFDFNIENSSLERDTHVTISNESVYDDKILEVIHDLVEVNDIFDDKFTDIPAVTSNHSHVNSNKKVDDFLELNTVTNISMHESHSNSLHDIDNYQYNCSERNVHTVQFDENTFDRNETIKELIELACKKYKISIPKENTIQKLNKRKVNFGDNGVSEPKKKRTIVSKPGEAKLAVDNFISAYYNTLQADVFNDLTQQVKSIIENVDNTNNIDNVDVVESENINESLIMNIDDNINSADSSYLKTEEHEHFNTDVDPGDSVIEDNQAVVDLGEKNEESDAEEIFHELFPKSDPMFDEKEHDIRQLYVELEKDLDEPNVSMSNIGDDPEIDIIIKKQIEKYSNIDQTTLFPDKLNAVRNKLDFSDSDDDVPLNVFKDIDCYERGIEERKKYKLKPFITDPSSVRTFKYWVRHYKSPYVLKLRDVGQKFDLELNENLPASFAFVIRECAAMLGYTTFALYKHMQNIEEILITRAY